MLHSLRVPVCVPAESWLYVSTLTSNNNYLLLLSKLSLILITSVFDVFFPFFKQIPTDIDESCHVNVANLIRIDFIIICLIRFFYGRYRYRCVCIQQLFNEHVIVKDCVEFKESYNGTAYATMFVSSFNQIIKVKSK